RRHVELPHDAIDGQRNCNLVRDLNGLFGGALACQCHMHLRMTSAPFPDMGRGHDYCQTGAIEKICAKRRSACDRTYLAIPRISRTRATTAGDTSAVAATSFCTLSPDSGLNSERD